MRASDIINSLHPLERRVLPFLAKAKSFEELVKLSGLKDIEVMRALQWLQNKGILKIREDVRKVVSLDQNGKKYVKEGLPEKRFLKAVSSSPMTVEDIMKAVGLNKEEINACLGMLRRKAAIDIEKKDNVLTIKIKPQGLKLVNTETLEEKFINSIITSRPVDSLEPEEKFALDELNKRRNIIKVDLIKDRNIDLTKEGKQLSSQKIDANVLDRLTPELLKTGKWKNKNFRAYDIQINVPKISRSKRHFVSQAINYIKKIWLEMGFEEMQGSLTQTSFWDLDSLFVPQDHPARTMQDTFYIKDPKSGTLPKIAKTIKEVHETGGDTGSTGWKAKWSEDFAKENLLRTHTTVLSAQTINKLKESDIPAKFFSVGRVFRNEALDAHHLFEFYQVEGIVVDPNANLKNLKGYLKEFFGKMGFTDIRMRPAHFPYTEPSVEVDVFDPHHKRWIELGGAGIFRPEITKPLIGKETPVLAWGMGMERIIASYFDIHDIRDIYRNDLKKIREIKEWMR